jgi:hypothetical protein
MNICVSGVQIVQRMFCATFPAGSTILLQNAQPSAEDCMYYLADGQAEVVIMGTADRASKSGGLAGHIFLWVRWRAGWDCVSGGVWGMLHTSRVRIHRRVVRDVESCKRPCIPAQGCAHHGPCKSVAKAFACLCAAMQHRVLASRWYVPAGVSGVLLP